MSATTLNWAAINLNGKVIPKMGLLGSCSIRCEWIQARYVTLFFSSMQYHHIWNRCRLVIMGPGMETIELYVEVDVTSITYSILGPRAIGAPIIILSVELSRPTNWAGNGGKSLLSSSPVTWTHSCVLQTMSGKVILVSGWTTLPPGVQHSTKRW